MDLNQKIQVHTHFMSLAIVTVISATGQLLARNMKPPSICSYNHLCKFCTASGFFASSTASGMLNLYFLTIKDKTQAYDGGTYMMTHQDNTYSYIPSLQPENLIISVILMISFDLYNLH